MLKNILDIKSAQKLDKKSQLGVLGGMQFLCEETCVFNFRLCYINKTETFYQPC
jgi:hypothetical protein